MNANNSFVVDVSWDFERVWQLELSLYGEKAGADPLGPLGKWQALQNIEDCRLKFLNGDRAALFFAINQCATRELVIPEWAASAFRRGYSDVASFRVDSWDKAFGAPFPKGFKVAQGRRRLGLIFIVHGRILDIYKREQVAIDDELFQRVANEFHIGKRQCKQFWYNMGGLPGKRVKKTLPP